MDYPVFDEAAALDPHPVLDAMREHDPVWRCELLNGWMLTRYADAATLFRDERMRMNANTDVIDALPPDDQAALAPLRAVLALWMGQLPRDGHLRLQKIFRQYFTVKRIQALRPRVRVFTEQLLSRADPSSVDIVGELAYPLPVAVIGEMLGVPEADFPKILDWSRDLEAIFNPLAPVEQLYAARDNVLAMQAYCRVLLHERLAAPREDVLSVLGAALQAGELSEAEILANCVVLLFAGHETTAGQIAYGLYQLLQAPEQRDWLRSHPEGWPAAVNEMLRFCGPAHMVVRVPREPVSLAGVTLQPGEPVFLMVNAANRDPAVFADPHRFDVRRKSEAKHLGFGQGPYYCLGAALAEMEVAEVLGYLLEQYPAMAAVAPPRFEARLPLGHTLAEYRVRLT